MRQFIILFLALLVVGACVAADQKAPARNSSDASPTGQSPSHNNTSRHLSHDKRPSGQNQTSSESRPSYVERLLVGQEIAKSLREKYPYMYRRKDSNRRPYDWQSYVPEYPLSQYPVYESSYFDPIFIPGVIPPYGGRDVNIVPLDVGGPPVYGNGGNLSPMSNVGQVPLANMALAPLYVDTGSAPKADTGSPAKADKGSSPNADTGSPTKADKGSSPKADKGSSPKADTGPAPKADTGTKAAGNA